MPNETNQADQPDGPDVGIKDVVSKPPIGFEPKSYRSWRFDLVSHIVDQKEFSYATFGPPCERGSEGVIDHLRKELKEVEDNPADLEEWIDIIMLAIDGACREGHAAVEIATALANKLEINKSRDWPDWRTAEKGKVIEHARSC